MGEIYKRTSIPRMTEKYQVNRTTGKAGISISNDRTALERETLPVVRRKSRGRGVRQLLEETRKRDVNIICGSPDKGRVGTSA